MSSRVARSNERSAVVDGVRIVFDDRDGAGPPLVVLHGFLGSAAAMAPLIEALDASRGDAGRRIVAIDLVGHGRSDAPPQPAHYGFERVVDHIGAVLDTVGGADDGARVADLLGYSMGGRLALATALARPEQVRRLVLVGATAGIDDADERRARRNADAELAAFVDQHGVDAFVDRWEQLPIFATQLGLAPDVRERVRAGRAAQRGVGVANSLRGSGTGSMEPMGDRLVGFFAPTLVVAGALDAKYVEIGERLVDALPGGRFLAIAGAGHAVHVERPEATAAAVEEFLGESDTSERPGVGPW